MGAKGAKGAKEDCSDMSGPQLQVLESPGKGVIFSNYGMRVNPTPTGGYDAPTVGTLQPWTVVQVEEFIDVRKRGDARRCRVSAPIAGFMDTGETQYTGGYQRWVPVIARHSDEVEAWCEGERAKQRALEEKRRRERRKRLEEEEKMVDEINKIPDPVERQKRKLSKFYPRAPASAPFRAADLTRWAQRPAPRTAPALKVVVRDRWKGDTYIRLTEEDVQQKRPANPGLNAKLSLWQGSIVFLEVDAIVNAANEGLYSGGGICGAIHDQAGPLLSLECEEIPEDDQGKYSKVRCKTGGAKITKGYRLFAGHVIHAVGPTSEDCIALYQAYKSTLDLVRDNKLRTVALCCISTGIFGFPLLSATHVALRAIRDWLEEGSNADAVDLIVLCVFLDHERDVYELLLPTYFPHEDAPGWRERAAEAGAAAGPAEAGAAGPEGGGGDAAPPAANPAAAPEAAPAPAAAPAAAPAEGGAGEAAGGSASAAPGAAAEGGGDAEIEGES